MGKAALVQRTWSRTDVYAIRIDPLRLHSCEPLIGQAMDSSLKIGGRTNKYESLSGKYRPIAPVDKTREPLRGAIRQQR